MAAASDDAVTGSAGEDADRQHSCAMALALEAIAGGHSFLLTGAAGTGKSFFVGNLVRELDARLSSTLGCDGSYFVTAMTGAAATLLDVKGCTTFHSAFGITTGEETVAGWCEKVRRRRHLYEELRALTVCIVDECSMMSQDLFDKLHLVLQEIRDCPDKPFGGIVVVFIGDFFQLPPVTRHGTAAFLFSSPSFPSLVPFRWELSCYVRHASDAAYLSMLRDLRVGRNTAQVRTYLDGLVSPLAQRSVSEGGVHHTICLLSTRERVRSYNLQAQADFQHRAEDASAQAEHHRFPAASWGDTASLATLAAEDNLLLYENDPVIFIARVPNTDIVNGTLATVVGFTPIGGVMLPRVRLAGSGIEVVVRPQTHTVSAASGGVCTAGRTQLPLLLAYALTIHRAQGLTLHRMRLDPRHLFQPQQLYVGLSRAPSSKAVTLLAPVTHSPPPDKTVVAFYSDASMTQLSHADLHVEQARIRTCVYAPLPRPPAPAVLVPFSPELALVVDASPLTTEAETEAMSFHDVAAATAIARGASHDVAVNIDEVRACGRVRARTPHVRASTRVLLLPSLTLCCARLSWLCAHCTACVLPLAIITSTRRFVVFFPVRATACVLPLAITSTCLLSCLLV